MYASYPEKRFFNTNQKPAECYKQIYRICQPQSFNYVKFYPATSSTDSHFKSLLLFTTSPHYLSHNNLNFCQSEIFPQLDINENVRSFGQALRKPATPDFYLHKRISSITPGGSLGGCQRIPLLKSLRYLKQKDKAYLLIQNPRNQLQRQIS